MAKLYILRITPGGTAAGVDKTLWSKDEGVVSIGWSYLPNMIGKTDTQIYDIVKKEESDREQDHPSHINYVAKVFQIFLNKIKVGDYLLIPRPSMNGHDGTDIYVAKVTSEIKFKEEWIEKGCAYYREAEWYKKPFKWRSSPYDPSKIMRDIPQDLMQFLWHPKIKRSTLSDECTNEHLSIARQLFYKQ